MEIIKKAGCHFYGIKTILFTVVFMTNVKEYYYYVNVPFSNNLGDHLIYKSKTKSKLMNKYTLSVLGIITSIFSLCVIKPIMVISLPIVMYILGGKRFIKGSTYSQHVRYFNWVNILLVTFFVITYLINTIHWYK